MPSRPAPKPSLWTPVDRPARRRGHRGPEPAADDRLGGPSIRFWCLFLGVVILLTTLGMAATVWVICQPADVPLRQQFLKSLDAASASGTWENPRNGTPAQTAHY